MIRQAFETDRFKAETPKSSMNTEVTAAEALKQINEAEGKEFGWESNRDDENPKHLPWPEENESKE